MAGIVIAILLVAALFRIDQLVEEIERKVTSLEETVDRLIDEVGEYIQENQRPDGPPTPRNQQVPATMTRQSPGRGKPLIGAKRGGLASP